MQCSDTGYIVLLEMLPVASAAITTLCLRHVPTPRLAARCGLEVAAPVRLPASLMLEAPTTVQESQQDLHQQSQDPDLIP